MTNRDGTSDQASELRQQAEKIALEKPALSLEDIHAKSAEERLRVALNNTHGHGLAQSGHVPALHLDSQLLAGVLGTGG